jgi:hypothetical protein
MAAAVGWDWKRWRHGPFTGPAHASAAMVATWQVGTLPAVGLQPEQVIGTGCVAAGIVTLRTLQSRRSVWRWGYRVAALGGGSVWVGHALSQGWSAELGWWLAGGAGAAAGLLPAARAVDRRRLERRAATADAAAAAAVDAAEQAQLVGLAGEWVARIERVCRVKLLPPKVTDMDDAVKRAVPGIEFWLFPGPDGRPRQTGYTLEVVLPATGVTWRTIKDFEDNLAAAANLPESCGVEVGPGASKRCCIIEVATLDALRDDMPYVPATRPGDVDAVPFGIVRNGSAQTAPLRFESTLLVGAKRSGKTNELLVLMARLLECDNTLLCVIDYNGGAAALPWLAPWADGTIDRPPILWVADNPEEAALMCNWLVNVIAFRKRHYHAANTARDDDKIHATRELPQIVLVTDEFGALGSKIKEHIWQINDRGGGAAVTTLTCSLGSTQSYVPTELLAQLSNRIAMRVNQESALGYLFDWHGGKGRARPEDAPHTGYGHFRIANGQPKVFKAPRIVPSMIRQVAVTTAAWRPELDAATAEMDGTWARVFAGRWDRSRHLIAAVGGDPAAVPGGDDDAAAERPRSEASGTGSSGDPMEELGQATASLDSAAERLRAAMNNAGGGPPPRDEGRDRQAFEEIMAGTTIVPELVVRILTVFGDADRMHTRTIAARIGARAETLGQLLSTLEVRPLKNAFHVGGEPGRGYERAAIEHAAERIRAGELEPPPVVMRWQPEVPPEAPEQLPPEWS